MKPGRELTHCGSKYALTCGHSNASTGPGFQSPVTIHGGGRRRVLPETHRARSQVDSFAIVLHAVQFQLKHRFFVRAGARSVSLAEAKPFGTGFTKMFVLEMSIIIFAGRQPRFESLAHPSHFPQGPLFEDNSARVFAASEAFGHGVRSHDLQPPSATHHQ